MRRPAVFAPLVHRNFRLLAAGQAVSGLGDWLDYLGLIVLVAFVWHGGPAGLALLAVGAALPWVVVSPFAGVLVDRLPGRTVLVGSDLVRAGVVLCYPLAPNLAVLIALVVLKTCASTVFVPAQLALVTRVVPADERLAANALTTFIGQGTKIAGPAAGGLLVAAGGPNAAFVADAATFLVSALLLAGLPAAQRTGTVAERREPVLSAARAGALFIVRNRVLALAVTAMTATVFLVFAFDTLSPLALARLGMGPSLLGLALAGVGLGAVLGAVGVGQYGRRFRPLVVIGCGQGVVGAVVGALGLGVLGWFTLPVPVWFGGLVLLGTAAAGILVMQPYLLQQQTPVALIGRVSATALAVTTAMQLLAPPLGAAAAARFGVGTVFLLGGLGLVALGAVVLVLHRGPAVDPAALGSEPIDAEVVAHSVVPAPVVREQFRAAIRRPAAFG